MPVAGRLALLCICFLYKCKLCAENAGRAVRRLAASTSCPCCCMMGLSVYIRVTPLATIIECMGIMQSVGRPTVCLMVCSQAAEHVGQVRLCT